MTDETNFTILASCDVRYFRLFAPAFVTSAALAKNNVHINVIIDNSPGSDQSVDTDDLKLVFEQLNSGENTLTFSEKKVTFFEGTAEFVRTYYACNRFLIAPSLLRAGQRLFITDIDCMFMKHVDEPDADVGLFLRDSLPGTFGWEAEGTKTAAGAVYYNNTMIGREFAECVSQAIGLGRWKWFSDQVALSQAFEIYKQDIRFHCFDPQFMDWEFKEGTTIWTGKGPRKFDNPTYTAMQQKFDQIYKDTLNGC